LFDEQLRNSVISNIKQILDTESNKINEILCNVKYSDPFDIAFHKGVLDLSTKFRKLSSVSKMAVTFEEEEIISRYLFQNNRVYSGITFNPIEFYKNRIFYLKLHERLLLSKIHKRGKKIKNKNDFNNCRIVLTDIDDVKVKVYDNKKSSSQGEKKISKSGSIVNLENLLNLWLFIKWHKDHNVSLYYMPIDVADKIFTNRYSKVLWTKKMGIFFDKYILLMGAEKYNRNNNLEREIQISNASNQEYKVGLDFFSELYDHKDKEDFASVIYEYIPQANLDSLTDVTNFFDANFNHGYKNTDFDSKTDTD